MSATFFTQSPTGSITSMDLRFVGTPVFVDGERIGYRVVDSVTNKHTIVTGIGAARKWATQIERSYWS